MNTVFFILSAILWCASITYSQTAPPLSNSTKKVIVIGAGIAGLTAAQQLKKAGMDVIVLESQSKIGGRINTDRTLNVPFERGASWIHGIIGNPIAKLVNQRTNPLYLTPFNKKTMTIYTPQGTVYDPTTVENTEYEYEKLIKKIENEAQDEESILTILKKDHRETINNPLIRFFFSVFTVFDLGGLDKVSAEYINHGDLFPGEDALILNGHDSILENMAKNIPTMLNSKVLSIDYTGSNILVSTKNTTISGDFVLLTVPLGVLKKNSIKFTPDLPKSKKTAIENMGFNQVDKFLFVWEKVFWDDTVFIGRATSEFFQDDQFNFFVNIHSIDKKTPALMTFAFDKKALLLAELNDQQVIKNLMSSIRKVYPKAPEPSSMLRTTYSKDPNFYGSYSFMSTSTMPQYHNDIATTVDNKIFFAGEHTHPKYFSTTHGAYLSGLREAKKILKLSK